MIYRAKVTAIEAQARRAWPFAKFVKDGNDVYIETKSTKFSALLEIATIILDTERRKDNGLQS